jgi:hypothetical protein
VRLLGNGPQDSESLRRDLHAVPPQQVSFVCRYRDARTLAILEEIQFWGVPSLSGWPIRQIVMRSMLGAATG